MIHLDRIQRQPQPLGSTSPRLKPPLAHHILDLPRQLLQLFLVILRRATFPESPAEELLQIIPSDVLKVGPSKPARQEFARVVDLAADLLKERFAIRL